MKPLSKICRLRSLWLLFFCITFCFSKIQAQGLPDIYDISFSSYMALFQSKDGRVLSVFKNDISHLSISYSSETLNIPKDIRGHKISLKQANCSAEGDNSPHSVKIDGKDFKTCLNPCSSILALEIVGDTLWLGSGFYGEYGLFPAEGICAQNIENKEIKFRLSIKDGLSQNLIKVIKKEPEEPYVWAVSALGINKISIDGKILLTGYFYEDFNPANGAVEIFISSAVKAENKLAKFGQAIKPADKLAYYKAAAKIPEELHSCLNLLDRQEERQCESIIKNGGFLPEEFNILLPFLFEAARKKNEQDIFFTGIKLLCELKEKSIPPFILKLEKETEVKNPYLNQLLQTCASKYDKAGFLSETDKKSRRDFMAKKISSILEKTKQADTDESYYLKIMSDSPADTDTLIDYARTLFSEKDNRGIDLINKHFYSSSGGTADGYLFETIQARMWDMDEIAPAMAAGLERIIGAQAVSGCNYFSSDFNMPGRKKAIYLKSILKALENAVYEKVPHQPEQADWVKEACVKAFEFQISDASVKSDFLNFIYPKLEPESKKKAEEILSVNSFKNPVFSR